MLLDLLHLFSFSRVSLAEYPFVLSVCVEMFLTVPPEEPQE